MTDCSGADTPCDYCYSLTTQIGSDGEEVEDCSRSIESLNEGDTGESCSCLRMTLEPFLVLPVPPSSSLPGNAASSGCLIVERIWG